MKMRLILILFLVTNGLIAQEIFHEIYVQILNLDEYFKPFNGSFVLLDLKTGLYKAYNDSIFTKRYSPCSTFKIANSLIGIESGVAEDENYLIKYDSMKTPPKPWWHIAEPQKHWMQDQTMRTAIRNSVVWYYQELARRIGNENMTKFLRQIDYGNNDISSGIDNFWLCGSLKISAMEQVEFLEELYNNQLTGFSIRTQEIVKDIILNESTDYYKLYGKTGGGDCWDDKVIGWYVGFLEIELNTYIFAMNVFVNDFSDLGNNMRIEITKNIFKGLNIIK
jgi:beta-lactamase class D